MAVILAIDQGTTGTTVLAVNREGKVAGRAYREIEQHYPQPGWVEHDAEEIWRSVQVTVGAALEAGDLAPSDVAGFGITNQRETVVLWDRESGEPIHRAIVWQCRRTTPECQALKDGGHEAFIRERSGLVIDPYFSGTKIAWLLEHVPGARQRAEAGELAVGTIDSWVIWKLSGGRVHATEPTNASRTQLFRIDERRWDPELCELLGVPTAVLPEVLPSGGLFGMSDGDAVGLEAPVAAAMGDQQAALYGQGCWAPGQAKCTYGTGAFLLVHTGDEVVPSQHGLLTTVACGARGEAAYALEGSVFIAGAAVQWLRDELGLVDSAAETEELARSLESNDGVYFVPAFVGLGARRWPPTGATRCANYGSTAVPRPTTGSCNSRRTWRVSRWAVRRWSRRLRWAPRRWRVCRRATGRIPKGFVRCRSWTGGSSRPFLTTGGKSFCVVGGARCGPRRRGRVGVREEGIRGIRELGNSTGV
jgi:glycerol kinase